MLDKLKTYLNSCKLSAKTISIVISIEAKNQKERKIISTGNIPDNMNLFKHAIKNSGLSCNPVEFREDSILFEIK